MKHTGLNYVVQCDTDQQEPGETENSVAKSTEWLEFTQELPGVSLRIVIVFSDFLQSTVTILEERQHSPELLSTACVNSKVKVLYNIFSLINVCMYFTSWQQFSLSLLLPVLPHTSPFSHPPSPLLSFCLEKGRFPKNINEIRHIKLL